MRRRSFMKTAAAGVLLPAALNGRTAAAAVIPHADLVLRGGIIATVDRPFSIVQAAAARDGRIVFAGSDIEAARFIGPKTRVVDLGGRLAVPGFIDAHVHLRGYAVSLLNLDFRGTARFEDIAGMVAAEAKKRAPGEWILGRNWDQNDWPVKDMPVHDLLTKAAPEHPVWLVRVDGHAGIANRKTMDISGIGPGTKSPDGGEILRGSDGKPTGVFVDEAMGLIQPNIPDISPERTADALEAASKNLLAAGITAVHDAGASPGTIALYKRLIDGGRLGVRVYAMLSDPGGGDAAEYFRENRVSGYGNHRLDVRSVKLFMDGALGSRGAALFEPYTDRPGYSGLLTTTPEHVFEISRAALETGFQVATHAIGDRANRLVLDAYERAFRERPTPDHRFRIEHAQVVSPADIPRFKALGVLPSMQPTHATSDMLWAEARVGPVRIRGAYACRLFLDTGCIVPCGSDFPVEEINPLYGVHAAVTRRDRSGNPPGGWMPGQCMTRAEALRGFTGWAASAAFRESMLGSIEPGKLADIVVLSKDILACPPEEIPSTAVDLTIVDGEIAYQR